MANFFKPPGPPWTLPAVVFFGVGSFLLAQGAVTGGWVSLLGGAWLAVMGFGLWRARSWTRFATTLTMVIVAIGNAWALAKLGFAWSRVAMVGIGVLGVWHFWRELSPAKTSGMPMVSLVLLLRQPKYLEAVVLAEVLKSAWGLPFEVSSGSPSESEASAAKPFVIGESPIFIVGTGGAMFMIHNHARSYVENPEKAAESIADLRLRKFITDQQAWLSVDCMWTVDGQREAQYTRIARAVAELADDSVVGLFEPEADRLIPWDAAMEARLRKGENLEAIFTPEHAPVVQISDDDPRMQAAVAEARRRWPEFVAAFKARQPGGNYAVKAPVSREGNTEFIWLEVIGLEPEYIHGKLANDPVDLGGLKLGDQAEVAVKDLNDWTFSHQESAEPTGLFTMKVLAEAFKAQQSGKNEAG